MVFTSTPPPRPLSAKHQEQLLNEYAARCDERMKIDPGFLQGHNASCPPTWDGIACWERTPAGQLAIQPCPSIIVGFDPRLNASRMCTLNGSWYWHPEMQKEWTNFSQCFSSSRVTVLINAQDSPYGNNETSTEFQFQPYLPALKIISEIGYAVSLVSLVVAFIILASIKKLRCPRNVLHMHLFASFVMRAFMSLLKDTLFVMGLGLASDVQVGSEGTYLHVSEANWPCRLITTLWHYFIMANYSWILMEGLYLHNLIFLALFTDSSSIALYIGLGWGLPALFMIPWATCRALLENNLCWTTNDDTTLFLLIRVPVTLSIVLNFILFINIVRVLLLKLKSSAGEETKTYRRWAKSTLVLVPLFGVHYMVFLGLSLGTDSAVELVWLFCNQLFASFQGFFVALLYCFLNGEVRTEVSKKWRERDMLLFFGWCEGRGCAGGGGKGGGGGGGGRLPAKGRPSCYSSTSFTSVSLLPSAAHCCKKRGSSAAGLGALENVHEVPDYPDDDVEVKKASPKNKNRSFSISFNNLQNSAMELESLSSPKKEIVKF